MYNVYINKINLKNLHLIVKKINSYYVMHKDDFKKTNSLRIFFHSWNFLFQTITTKLSDHRLAMRTQLQNAEPSLPLVISLLPFLFGFHQYLQTEYYSVQRKYFFNKNLPGLISTPEKINWDTFILLKNKNLTDSITYWNNSNLLIHTPISNRRILTSTYNYKASIFDPSQTRIFKTKYNTLPHLSDKLPFKLQSLNNQLDQAYETFEMITIKNIEIESKVNSDELNINFNDQSIPRTKIQGLNKYLEDLNDKSLDIYSVNLTKQKVKLNSELVKLIDLESNTTEFLVHSLPTRFMSGYLFPDMSLTESIKLDNLINPEIIELQLPFSFLSKTQVSEFIDIPPKILIETQQVNIDDNSPFQFTYSGPSLKIDNQTGFDWKFFNSQNQIEFRKWLKTQLQLNSFNEVNQNNFFGLFESPESVNSKFQPRVINNLNEYWLQNLPIFHTGNFIKPNNPKIQNKDLVQFPFISTNYLSNLVESSSNNKLTLQLPILQANLASQTKPISLTKNTFEFKPEFSDSNIKINFLQNTTAPLIIEYSNDQLTSGIYRSVPSVFQPTKNTLFSIVWEPLTFKSWLVTCQIGFGFLVFKVLKALADNYGRELLVYLLDLVALLGFVDEELKQEIEILMGQKEKGFRIISKTNQNFNNIGGIKNLIPDIIEIVWFLRNSGRSFSLSKIIPRGILLTGPPGTGKTLLVQAIAGEAEVPVIALSGSSLLEPGESGALKLELVFQEARQLAPCIVFIDEIDTLAEKREQVLQNPMGADEILESLSVKHSSEIKTENSGSDTGQQEMYKEKLRILMQFLVELDGIQGRSGVVVIGATNRPEILDPAVLRPGRFDRVLELGLPNATKRSEIFHLYSKNLGTDTEINWDYFVDRTVGYSAADIASIMNQSTLCAVLNTTNHTIETIEFGIDRTTTIGFEKPISCSKTNLEIIQLAYYQIGKLLISFLLTECPDVLVAHLWPRRLNIRALQINKNLQTYFFQFAHRSQLEERLISCYAGKASEILFLENYSTEINLSDLGVEDIEFAQNLINLMIDQWYLYTKTTSIQNQIEILSDFNSKEYFNQNDKIENLNEITTKSEINLESEIEEFINTFSRRETENIAHQQAQTYLSSSIWQAQIATEFEFATRLFSDWYRIYLPDPQQIERNLEWIPPDEYSHSNSLLNFNQSHSNWNTELLNSKEYLINSLNLQSYNEALKLLDDNRETLDLLVTKLLKDEVIRKPEIGHLIKNLKYRRITKTDSFDKTWGNKSRKPTKHSIKI